MAQKKAAAEISATAEYVYQDNVAGLARAQEALGNSPEVWRHLLRFLLAHFQHRWLDPVNVAF